MCHNGYVPCPWVTFCKSLDSSSPSLKIMHRNIHRNGGAIHLFGGSLSTLLAIIPKWSHASSDEWNPTFAPPAWHGKRASQLSQALGQVQCQVSKWLKKSCCSSTEGWNACLHMHSLNVPPQCPPPFHLSYQAEAQNMLTWILPSYAP